MTVAVDEWAPMESDRLDVEVLMLRHGRELVDWCRAGCGRGVVDPSRWRARVLGTSKKVALGPAPGPRGVVVWAKRRGLCSRCVNAGHR